MHNTESRTKVALKRIWKGFIKDKMGLLKFEKFEEAQHQENTYSNLELLELKKFYQELDEPDQEFFDISNVSPLKLQQRSRI